jgi:N-acetylmuramoyl-L-alanine amidase
MMNIVFRFLSYPAKICGQVLRSKGKPADRRGSRDGAERIRAKVDSWNISRRFAAVLAVGTALLSCPAQPVRASEEVSEGRRASATASALSAQRSAATAVRVEDTGQSAKLIFELTAPVEASSFVLTNPDRAVVDLPQVDFALAPEAGRLTQPRHARARGAARSQLIAAFRFGWLGQGKSRIVIDLGAPSRIIEARSKPGPGGGHLLTIELARTDRASFRAAAQQARAKLSEHAEAAPAKAPAATGKPVVVIDPGHGGIDSGATVNGLTEKTIVLDFARTLAAKLEAEGRVAVVMTRDDDRFVTLADRVRIARESEGLLFVSLHADTLVGAKQVAGATVYTLSEQASDAEAARLAAKENQADAAAGLDGIDDAEGVSEILSDLTLRETRALSHVFARTLINYWKIAGRLNKNPRRSAGFRVLKAPDVPSVLLELGYMSNEKDDQALSSAEWRDKTASTVAQAINAYFTEKEGSVALTAADGRDSKSGRLVTGK